MIRLAITPAAFDAITATLPLGSTRCESRLGRPLVLPSASAPIEPTKKFSRLLDCLLGLADHFAGLSPQRGAAPLRNCPSGEFGQSRLSVPSGKRSSAEVSKQPAIHSLVP
jgi:hypothetical protein